MSRLPVLRASTLLALAPILLTLTQCAPPPLPTGQARADAATLAACREHSDAAYNRQNRDTIYAISSPNAPYSANYTPGLVDRGLAQRYGYENMTRDCVRNTGLQTERSDPAPPEPAKP